MLVTNKKSYLDTVDAQRKVLINLYAEANIEEKEDNIKLSEIFRTTDKKVFGSNLELGIMELSKNVIYALREASRKDTKGEPTTILNYEYLYKYFLENISGILVKKTRDGQPDSYNGIDYRFKNDWCIKQARKVLKNSCKTLSIIDTRLDIALAAFDYCITSTFLDMECTIEDIDVVDKKFKNLTK